MPNLPTIPNENPAVIFHKEVTFATQDEISLQNIIEGYNVNGPFHTSITSIALAGGTKFVVPLTSDSTSSNAPFLKFHFPNGTSGNKLYITFAVKNSRMADGYYDYKTGIPNTYRSKLKNFILAPQVNISNISGPKSKEIRFTVYGSSTNKPAEAVTFYVTFKAIFNSITTDVIAQPLSEVDLATGTGGVGTTPSTGTNGIPVSGLPGRTLGGVTPVLTAFTSINPG